MQDSTFVLICQEEGHRAQDTEYRREKADSRRREKAESGEPMSQLPNEPIKQGAGGGGLKVWIAKGVGS